MDWTMIGVIVGIVTTVCGAFAVLLQNIRRGDLQRVTNLEKSIKDLEKAIRDLSCTKHSTQMVKQEERLNSLAKLEKFINDIHADLEKTKSELSKEKETGAVSAKSIVYLEEAANRMNDTLEKMREELKDAVVTINGFGRDYVTRKEFYDAQQRYSSASPGVQR